MTRACATCTWWDLDGMKAKPRPVLNPGWAICKEAPHPIAKAPDDWCGRWKLSEREIGVADVRKSA